MNFYSSISENYDQIFPFKPPVLAFVMNYLLDPDRKRILDIGCGSGRLALELAQKGFAVDAIDYDRDMIALTERKMHSLSAGGKLRFQRMDMQLLIENFESGSFDSVLCFGNTLVHLTTLKKIDDFIGSLSMLLKKDGHLMVQILNYDYILTEKISSLPLIENDKIKFERYYDYPDGELINFRTILTIKKTNRIIHNSIGLYPLQKMDLDLILGDHHFTNIDYFGSFLMDDLKADSLPLVVHAVKQ